MWSKPEFNSERVNQLLFGDPVKTSIKRSGYVKVTQPDRYSGWVAESFLTQLKRNEYHNWLRNRNGLVAVKTTKLYPIGSKQATAPFFLYYGTKLIIGRSKDGFIEIQLPDNQKYRLRESGIIKQLKQKSKKIDWLDLISEARKFLGVPYLWGGITPSGFDCSGFVRAIFTRFGYDLPRDTKDQIKIGRNIKRTSIKTGDMLFFKRHVGLAIGKDNIIHCSVSNAGVQINSLNVGADNYSKVLDESFVTARRILP